MSEDEFDINSEIAKRESFQKSLRKFENDNRERIPKKNPKTKKEGTKSKKEKSFLKKKTISKRIIRPSKLTYVVRNQQPAPYVSRYFKDEVEQAKKELFFK